MADNPPAPGQTITNGDWGGQNQGLRIRLGLGTRAPAPAPTPVPKPQGFAGGSSNVLKDAIDNLNNRPADLALMRALNLAPQLPRPVPVPVPAPVPGYAAGIIDVPRSQSGPPVPVPDPNVGNGPWQYGVDEDQLAKLAPMLSGMMRSAQGAMPAVGASTAYNPGSNQPVSPTIGSATSADTLMRASKLAQGPSPATSMWGGLFGDRDTTAALDEQHQAASVLGRPDAQSYMLQHPEMLAAAEKDPSGFSTRLKPMLDAVSQVAETQAIHQMPGGRTLVVDHGDPAKLAAVAKATGATTSQASAFLEHQKYSDADLAHIIGNMPSAMVDKLWGMQHYLSPQQQMLPMMLHQLDAQAQDAKAKYDAAVANHASKAEQDKWKTAHDTFTSQRSDAIARMALQSSLYTLPQMNNFMSPPE